MKILAADDEKFALEALASAIREAMPGAELHTYSLPSAVIRAVRDENYMPDVAFLDIEMPGVFGLELAGILKAACPSVNIIFVTAFSQYALDAMALRPSGYVIKPATREKVITELDNLRNPPRRTVPARSIYIQCFGNFDVFVGGEQVHFLRSKAKEYLAYLVDRRGSGCTSAELAEALWEDGIYDRSRQKQLSVIRADLIKSLRLVGAERILTANRDSVAVDPRTFDCDYYMALAGDVAMINTFMGEYMMPYEWAELTTGSLMQQYQNNEMEKMF